jgi:hypothetical protein
LFVAEGIAHGYQTLVDDTEVYYQMTTRYHPEAARGVRWDDPMLAIDWPLPTIAVVSDATGPSQSLLRQLAVSAQAAQPYTAQREARPKNCLHRAIYVFSLYAEVPLDCVIRDQVFANSGDRCLGFIGRWAVKKPGRPRPQVHALSLRSHAWIRKWWRMQETC